MPVPNAPLFRDPIYDGAADPTIIWNPNERAWWLIYTNRRANILCHGISWAHGTDIGAASSTDGGATWLYRGTLRGLDFEPGRNTFWAPEVLHHAGTYHMYVSYIFGVPDSWAGQRFMLHMTSSNLWDWTYVSTLQLSSQNVIDACVYQLPSGIWRMWYKDEKHDNQTWAAESADLYNWNVVGPVITDCAHEGPNVFYWKDSYWMVTDPWRGLDLYRSDDAIRWEKTTEILRAAGSRTDDGDQARHAKVLINDDRAFIFYFTHPEQAPPDVPPKDDPLKGRRTSLQVAELELIDGKIVCDRNKPFSMNLNGPR